MAARTFLTGRGWLGSALACALLVAFSPLLIVSFLFTATFLFPILTLLVPGILIVRWIGKSSKHAEVLLTPAATDNRRASLALPDLPTPPPSFRPFDDFSDVMDLKDDMDKSDGSDDDTSTSSVLPDVDDIDLEEYNRQVCEEIRKRLEIRKEQLAKPDRGFAGLAVIEEEEVEDW
jgi:hypothetical protein